ncbi:MAG: tyrosine-type recombinase/integrase [Janthinobacterium lividum]
MSTSVQLYIRVRFPDGSYPYFKAAFAKNGRIKSQHGMLRGRAVEFPRCTYHLRFRDGGKRQWEAVGSDASLALTKMAKKAAELSAIADGCRGAEPLTATTPESVNKPENSERVEVPARQTGSDKRRRLTACAADYVVEIATHKSDKTFAAYRYAVWSFLSFCGYGVAVGTASPHRRMEYLEEIRREDILAWVAQLKAKGDAPRTVRNRVDHFQIFLHHWKIGSILSGSDLPKYTKKKVRAYNPGELAKLFQCSAPDESDLLNFLLCTGAREREARFACWSDVDLIRKTYTVTEHLDLGYEPKDLEEGTLPIPDLLVACLLARRKRYPHTRLIFPGKHGKSNGHALRTVKRLALNAGVNCGLCVNKKGESCAAYPVCRHVLLHKMRKTFASTLHHNGLPAQTLQRYLRHSDLTTTIAYIADQPDDQVRETINSTFAGFSMAV